MVGQEIKQLDKLDEPGVTEYLYSLREVEALTHLTFFKNLGDGELVVENIGDGNLNFVFRITNTKSHESIILKQALDYAAFRGPSFPLTSARSAIEAQVSLIHAQFAPQHVVQIFHYDASRALILMEDLSHLTLLRTSMLQQTKFPSFPEHIGLYLARIAFFTSDFGLAADTKKAHHAKLSSPEIRKLTEDLFFLNPYKDIEQNPKKTLLTAQVEDIRKNKSLRDTLARLKYSYLSSHQALLHGDMHTGSIFVGPSETKVIDAELAFFGPIGFDIGTLIGHIMLNFCAQPGLSQNAAAAYEYQEYLKQCVLTIWNTFYTEFSTLLKTQTIDETLTSEQFQQDFLKTILRDCLGYAGNELIKRIIGVVEIPDFRNIGDESIRATCESKALTLGTKLMLESDLLTMESALTYMVVEKRAQPAPPPVLQRFGN